MNVAAYELDKIHFNNVIQRAWQYLKTEMNQIENAKNQTRPNCFFALEYTAENFDFKVTCRLVIMTDMTVHMVTSRKMLFLCCFSKMQDWNSLHWNLRYSSPKPRFRNESEQKGKT